MTRYEWRYLSAGRVAHILGSEHEEVRRYDAASCGREPDLFCDWYGTGTQRERERCAALPACKLCLRQLKLGEDPRGG